ncbi:MAG TPA: type II toxin-antitoxin system VapC family toxin [Longimicrobiaceae bacterium]|nr:type II toxin-antitoxin system VapC family toxin [Longimicrobiaceae bacterium]
MVARVYVETSIISYLTARPSRDLVVAGHQQLTLDWWQTQRPRFRICVSQLVVREASGGDPQVAGARLAVLNGVPLLETRPDSVALARALVEGGPLPSKAAADALHIAVAASHGVEYLLTWNCKHIANAEMRPLIERICRGHGFEPPVLCTPEELMGG